MERAKKFTHIGIIKIPSLGVNYFLEQPLRETNLFWITRNVWGFLSIAHKFRKKNGSCVGDKGIMLDLTSVKPLDLKHPKGRWGEGWKDANVIQ